MRIIGFVMLSLLATAAAAQQASDNSADIVNELKLTESALPVREMPFWRKPERIHMVPPGYTDEERARQIAEAQAAIGDRWCREWVTQIVTYKQGEPGGHPG